MTEKQTIEVLEMNRPFAYSELQKAIDMAIQALEEIQAYRAMEERLKKVYGECDGILEVIVSSLEKHENLELPSIIVKSRLLTDEDVDMWDAYRAIGTVEEIHKKLAELDRWHTDKINGNIKNPFAYTSTSICHNCDHKDDYIEELETELEELQALKEKNEPKKVCSTHGIWSGDNYFKFPDNAVVHQCTECYSTVKYGEKYCYYCGQKLDWS